MTAYLIRKGLGLKVAQKKLKKTRANPESFRQWRLLKKYSKKTGQLKIRELRSRAEERLQSLVLCFPVSTGNGRHVDDAAAVRQSRYQGFRQLPEPEEIQYMRDKLINPALERFIEVVAEGRKEHLSLEEVELYKALAEISQEKSSCGLKKERGIIESVIDFIKKLFYF